MSFHIVRSRSEAWKIEINDFENFEISVPAAFRRRGSRFFIFLS